MKIDYDNSFNENDNTTKLTKAEITQLIAQNTEPCVKSSALRIVTYVTTALGIIFLGAALFHKDHSTKINDVDASVTDIAEVEISAEPSMKAFIPAEDVMEAGAPKYVLPKVKSKQAISNPDGLVMPWPNNEIKFRPKKREKAWLK